MISLVLVCFGGELCVCLWSGGEVMACIEVCSLAQLCCREVAWTVVSLCSFLIWGLAL